MSGFANWILIYPFEAVRVLIMTDKRPEINGRLAMRILYERGGLPEFFKGCPIAVMRGAFLGFFSLPIYDFVLRFLSQF